MLRTKLSDALKVSMKAKQTRRTATLRLILAALKDRDIAARTEGASEGIGDEAILNMLQTMIRQRRESIEMYEKGGRADLVNQENEEIAIIEGFLPKQLTGEELTAAIKAVITKLGATTIKDMGRCMTALKETYAGQMDFAKASGILKQMLTAGGS
ncbi:MAG: GatB/YqeY domain-containing protein [Alphaproteobacteria bacterium]